MDEIRIPKISVITPDQRVGGDYPFLHRLDGQWMIVSADIAEEVVPSNDVPTLRWVNGSNDVCAYVEGMDLSQFQKESGLRFDLHKGAFVLSKRISRIMRPLPIWNFSSDVTIKYADFDKKAFDGAGVVSRKFLLRMIPHISANLSEARQRQMKHELRHAKRVEFTIVSERGQDKGHAMVCDDDVDWDFALPHDTKREVSLHDGTTFVGLIFPHVKEHARLDIQSMVNLWGFFTHEDMMQWIQDEADAFAESIESGAIAEVMGRISDADSQWNVAEYLGRGGHPMWFGSIVKSLMNQHIKRLEATLYLKNER